MAPKKPTGMSESDLKSINSVASSINKMNMDTKRSISGSAAKISSMGNSYKYIDKAGYTDRSVKEVSSSVVKILNKFSTTIETLSKGVLNITTATAKSTKNAISQYGQAISQDVSFNKQNAVAMALSQSTPIFGYFAAKFMETDVFKSAVGRMKDNIGRALSGIGQYIKYGWERFKSSISFEEHRNKKRRKKSGGDDDYFDSPKNASYRASKNIPKLQSGGLVSKSGVVYVHSGEVVAPINKIFKKSKYSSEQLLNSKVSLDKQGWLSKIYGTLLGLKIGMTGLGIDLKSHLLSFIVKNPVLRKMAMGMNILNAGFNKIPKFLFKIRNQYQREVPTSTNIQENMANMLAITYVRSMERYDQMIFYLRRLSEKITGEDVAPPGNKTYTNYQRIKNIESMIGLGSMFEMFSNFFKKTKKGKQLTGGGTGDYINAEYTNLNPTQKLLGYTPKRSAFGRMKDKAGGSLNYFRGAGVAATRERESKNFKISGVTDHILMNNSIFSAEDLAAESHYLNSKHASAKGLFSSGKSGVKGLWGSAKGLYSSGKSSAKGFFGGIKDRVSQFRSGENSTEKQLRLIQENTSGTKEGIKAISKKGKGILGNIGMVLMGVYSTFQSFLKSIPLIGRPLSWLLSAFKFIKWDVPAKIFSMLFKGGKFAAAGAWGATKLAGKGVGLGAKGLGKLLSFATKGGGLAAWGAIDSVIDAFKGAKNADKIFGGNASGMQKGFAGVGGLLGGEDQGSGVWGALKGALFGAIRGGAMGMMIPPWGLPIGAVLGGIFGAIGPVRIAKMLDSSWEGLKGVFSSIGDFLAHPIDNLENMGEKAWQYIKENPGKSTAMIAGAGIGFAFGGPAGLIAGALIGWGGGRFTEMLSGLWDKLVDVKNKYITPVVDTVKSVASGAVNAAEETYNKAKGYLSDADVNPMIQRAAAATGISASLIKAVMKSESGVSGAFNPNAKSKAGAVGLMQLMPDTAKMLKVTNRYDPEQSIMGGARYLKDLSVKYKGDTNKILSAYNSGYAHANNPETNAYIPKVKGYMEQYDKVPTKKDIAQMQTDQQMNQINANAASNKKLQDSTTGKLGEIGRNTVTAVSNAVTTMSSTNNTSNNGSQSSAPNPFDQELSNLLVANVN